MYSTTVYLYQQKTRVLMMDTGGGEYFTLRYDPVYAKKLTINLGVDNVILFEFINQDQKPVNITGSILTFRLLSQNGLELLLEEPMVILNGPTGRAKVTIPQQDLIGIRAEPASYSITRASGDLYEAVFTDAQAGARAPVDVVDSIYPEFMPSAELTIPTTNLGGSAAAGGGGSAGMVYPDWALQAGNPAINTYAPIQSTVFYSSFIVPTSPLTTVQMDLVGYTGTIKAQAAENYQSDWFDISDSVQYYNETRTIYWNIEGWHPIVRLAFNNSVYTTDIGNNGALGWPAQARVSVDNGVVTSVGVLNGGYGYLAPPLVEIFGTGAGATATATVSGGSVESIIVIAGGSGYRVVPPNNQEAYCVISTGRVENLVYR